MQSVKLGFRTEQLFGEGYRDAAKVMAHEVFELENTDILDTLSTTILKKSFTGDTLRTLSKLVSNASDINKETPGNIAYSKRLLENEDKMVGFFQRVLNDIKSVTGVNVKYALWLCDTVKDIKDNYEHMESGDDFTEFDCYPISDIVLSDIGSAGKLYGYEECPKGQEWLRG